jgi:hypothetical protein
MPYSLKRQCVRLTSFRSIETHQEVSQSVGEAIS